MGEQAVFQEILERIVRIETKIDGYNNLREKLNDAHNVACAAQEDIREIKDNQKWLWRTVGGTLIALFINIMFKFKGV